MSATSSGASRLLRGWHIAAVWLAALFGANANAACTIGLDAATPPSPHTVNAGTTQSFLIRAADDGTGCATATFTIVESFDDTDAAPGSQITSAASGALVIGNAFTVEIGIAFRGGGSATYDVICNNGCAAVDSLQLQYTYQVADVYEFGTLAAPTFVQGGTTVPLRTQLRRNGSAAGISPAEGMICFEFSPPPIYGSTLTGGSGSCGAGNAGRMAQSDANGRATVSLNVGTPIPIDGEPLTVVATAVNLPVVSPTTFDLLAQDDYQIELVSGNNQVVAPGATFQPLTIRTTRNGNAESALVDFLTPTNGASYQTPPPVPVATAADGTFTVTVVAGPSPGGVTVRVCYTGTGCDLNEEFNLTVSTSPALSNVSAVQPHYFVGQPTTFNVRAYNGGVPVDGAVIAFAVDPLCGSTNVALSSPSATTAGGGNASINVTPNTVSMGEPHCVNASWDVFGTPGNSADDIVASLGFFAEHYYEIQAAAATPLTQNVPVGSGATVTAHVLRDAAAIPFDPGAGVTFTQLGGPPLPGLPQATTVQSGPGEYSLNLTPSVVGTYTIEAKFDLISAPKAATGAKPVDLVFTVNATNAVGATPDDFSASPINGFAGGQTASVLANDTYNGAPATTSDLTPSIVSDGGLTGVGFGSNGEIVVPAGTSAGTYVVGYQVCEVAVPGNCSTASATIVITAPLINAADDDFSGSPVSGTTGGNTPSVLGNDQINGAAATAASVIPSIVSNGGLAGAAMQSSGAISVPPSSPVGSYPVSYQICDAANPTTNCDGATATVVVTAATRTLSKPTSGSGDNQSAAPGATLGSPLIAIAADNGVSPPSPVSIDWAISPPGSATITPNPSTTDANGQTSVSVTISAAATPGTPLTITATRADDASDPEVYNATVAGAGIRALIKPNTGSGDNQAGAQGQLAPLPLVAIATLDGAAQTGIQVDWIVQSGDASINSTTNPTDNQGRSTARVLFGPTATTVVVRAARADSSTALQTYTLTATPVRTLEKPPTGSGDRQTGEVGDELPLPLVVYALNNGVAAPGVQVRWTANTGVSVDSILTTTGPDGSTSVNATLGNTPGDFIITASRVDAPTATSSFLVRARGREPADVSLDKPSTGSGDGSVGAPGDRIVLAAIARADRRAQIDVRVLWEVLEGTATTTPLSFSGPDGVARSTVTLGNTPGRVRVRATRADSPEDFQDYTLTIQPGPNDLVLAVVSGDGQTGVPNSSVDPLVARLTRGGQPVAGETVTWQLVSGAAQLSATNTVTDANGNVQIGVTLGSALGPVTIRASSGAAAVVFGLLIERIDPTSLTLRAVSGGDQTGPVGSRAALPLVVEVLDQDNRPVRGLTLEWQVFSGSATLDSAETTTGPSGQSTQGFRFGTAAGTVQIRARFSGSTQPFVSFNATAFVPTLELVSGNNQTALAGSPLPQDFVVGITGAAPGAALAGITVRWEVTAGGGSLGSATTTTAADGRSGNRLTLGPSLGVNRVTASIDGGSSVTFTANGQVQTQPLAAVSGNNQVIATRVDSAPLVVELRTAAGAPVQGAALTWSATNAQLRVTETTTDAQGRSSNTAQVLLPGAATVTVQLQAASGVGTQVVFTLDGGVGNIPQLDEEEETIGNAIDNLCPALVAAANLTPEEADLLARCLELVNNAGAHPDQVENALVQMQQDVAIAQANAALVAASTQFDNVKTRMAALRGGASGVDVNGLAIANSSGVMPLSFLPSAVVQSEGEDEGGSAAAETGSDFSRWGFFASGIIGRGEQDARSITPEYDYDTSGLTAGVDYRVNDAWIVGASLGYNKQDTDIANGRGGIDTTGWSVSAYSTWYQPSNWYFDGVLTLGNNDYDINRRIAYEIVGASGTVTRVDQRAEAATGGDQLSLALSFGRDFQKGAWTYGPYLRGSYTRVEFDGYAEELEAGPGSGLGLLVESRELKSMTGVLGGKVTYAFSRDWGILMPHAQIEWEHEFKDDPQSLVTRFLNDPTASAIRIEGDPVDTNYYNVGFGLSALFPGGRSAFFYYEHLAGSEGLSQDNLSLGVRIEF
jgi:outer membrane autotransporter protein